MAQNRNVKLGSRQNTLQVVFTLTYLRLSPDLLRVNEEKVRVKARRGRNPRRLYHSIVLITFRDQRIIYTI